MSDAALLRVRGLAVRIEGQEVIAPSSFDLHAHERVLLVGKSGAGKSVFANVLLGFVGPEAPGFDVRGSIVLDGRECVGAAPGLHDGHVGAVFQSTSLGLFDDLTVDQNLRFGSTDAKARAAVLERLDLDDPGKAVTACSGGQQVRVAVARTILRRPPVLVYDEPTVGLDSGSRDRVVKAIGDEHKLLSIVITHDYHVLADHVDAVLVLDPERRVIERLPADAETFAALDDLFGDDMQVGADLALPARLPWHARFASAWQGFAVGTSDVLLDALSLCLLPWVAVRLAHPLDGPRVRQAFARDLAPGVFLFVGVSAVLVAFTGTWFVFERLPERPYAEPLIQEDLLAGLGLIFTRVGVPLMTSVLLAAKLGASAAAQLGHMQESRQVDALHLLRVPVRRHLLLTTATGQLAAALVCCLLAAVLAWFTTMVVFLGTHPGWSARYFHAAWMQELGWTDVLWEGAKVGLSGLGVALVAYRTALAPKRLATDVVKGIHRTLLRSLLLVLLIHAVFAFFEF